ncbi:MAG: 2-phosphosulfolactate phosphatase [Methanobacteriaceae archaeon]
MRVSLSLERSLSKDISIMVDVLRASTTITMAMDNFSKIIPVRSLEEAIQLAMQHNSILAGERDGAVVDGFDVGNSPLDIQKFKGKSLVLTTTNGTRILEGIKGKTLIGSFVNATAVAEKALEMAEEHIEVVMAGVKGNFVIEDFLGAGEIISLLQEQELDEMALAALMATQNPEKVNEAVLKSRSAYSLIKQGFEADIDFCLKRDITTKVPLYEKGIIKDL